MFNVVLYQPEIPPNTGNIMRLCANAGCHLHLIRPLGFSLSDKYLNRAKLDYEMTTAVKLYDDFTEYKSAYPSSTMYLCSTKGTTCYTKVHFKAGDSLVFGSETRGLPKAFLIEYSDAQKIFIPMQPNTRSLNLANAVAIILYEAWRQLAFIQ